MTTSLHPHLDPELVDGVPVMQALLGTWPRTVDGIPAFRQELAARMAAAAPAPEPTPNVISADRMIPGLDGEPQVRVRVHRPVNQTTTLPCFYHIHAGGMILGSVDGEDPQMAAWVEEIDCVVVSVDYRLAPETPHPGLVHDCYAGLQWTAEHAAELNIDPARIAVGGESAGGGLSAATVLLARARGGPAVAFQYLIYPMLDDRNVTPSSQEFAGDWPGWPREINEIAWRAVLGEQVGSDDVSPYAAPARATDLAELPPTYLDVGNLEVFRDEDIDFAKRLMQAGVPVELHVYPGVFHGWQIAAPAAAITQRAIANRRAAMKRALHPAPGLGS